MSPVRRLDRIGMRFFSRSTNALQVSGYYNLGEKQTIGRDENSPLEADFYSPDLAIALEI